MTVVLREVAESSTLVEEYTLNQKGINTLKS